MSYLVAVFAGIACIACIAGAAWLLWPKQPENHKQPLSETALRSAFLNSKADLNGLYESFLRDRLTLIGYKFAGLTSSVKPELETKPQQLPPKHVDAYRRAMERLGVKEIVRDDDNTKAVRFVISAVPVSKGTVLRGYEVGDAQPEGRIVAQLNTDFSTFDVHDQTAEYVKLDQNWYLYQTFEGDGSPIIAQAATGFYHFCYPAPHGYEGRRLRPTNSLVTST